MNTFEKNPEQTPKNDEQLPISNMRGAEQYIRKHYENRARKFLRKTVRSETFWKEARLKTSEQPYEEGIPIGEALRSVHSEKLEEAIENIPPFGNYQELTEQLKHVEGSFEDGILDGRAFIRRLSDQAQIVPEKVVPYTYDDQGGVVLENPLRLKKKFDIDEGEEIPEEHRYLYLSGVKEKYGVGDETVDFLEHLFGYFRSIAELMIDYASFHPEVMPNAHKAIREIRNNHRAVPNVLLRNILVELITTLYNFVPGSCIGKNISKKTFFEHAQKYLIVEMSRFLSVTLDLQSAITKEEFEPFITMCFDSKMIKISKKTNISGFEEGVVRIDIKKYLRGIQETFEGIDSIAKKVSLTVKGDLTEMLLRIHSSDLRCIFNQPEWTPKKREKKSTQDTPLAVQKDVMRIVQEEEDTLSKDLTQQETEFLLSAINREFFKVVHENFNELSVILKDSEVFETYFGASLIWITESLNTKFHSKGKQRIVEDIRQKCREYLTSFLQQWLSQIPDKLAEREQEWLRSLVTDHLCASHMSEIELKGFFTYTTGAFLEAKIQEEFGLLIQTVTKKLNDCCHAGYPARSEEDLRDDIVRFLKQIANEGLDAHIQWSLGFLDSERSKKTKREDLLENADQMFVEHFPRKDQLHRSYIEELQEAIRILEGRFPHGSENRTLVTLMLRFLLEGEIAEKLKPSSIAGELIHQILEWIVLRVPQKGGEDLPRKFGEFVEQSILPRV